MFIDPPYADALLRGIALSIAALLWVILLVRIVGLRSLSKMTNFDFVMTVAMGSLVSGAARASEVSDLLQTGAAMVGLFAVQYIIAKLRMVSPLVERTVQNVPLLLMKDGHIIDRALADSRVAPADLRAKLREANVLDMSQVRAAILETTGDLSILHGDHLDPTLIEGVRCVD